MSETTTEKKPIVSLAEALPAEIARVSAKRERFLQFQEDTGRHQPGFDAKQVLMTAVTMQVLIQEGIAAAASGDIIRMIKAHSALKDYNDDD